MTFEQKIKDIADQKRKANNDFKANLIESFDENRVVSTAMAKDNVQDDILKLKETTAIRILGDAIVNTLSEKLSDVKYENIVKFLEEELSKYVSGDKAYSVIRTLSEFQISVSDLNNTDLDFVREYTEKVIYDEFSIIVEAEFRKPHTTELYKIFNSLVENKINEDVTQLEESTINNLTATANVLYLSGNIIEAYKEFFKSDDLKEEFSDKLKELLKQEV